MIGATSPSIASDDAHRLKGDYLPTEILMKIVALLGKRELISCLRASRFLYIIAAPIAHADFHIDLSKPVNPLIIRGVPIPPRVFTPLNTTLRTFIDRSGIQTQFYTITTRLPLPNPFDYVTFLTLTSHDRFTCSSLSLVLPNLDTLRVEPSGEEELLDLCRSSSALSALHSPPHTCPLIASLRPRRLILGGCGTGLDGSAAGLWGTPSSPHQHPFPPPFVKELVILFGLYCARDLSPVACAPFFQHIPASVEKITFVEGCYDETWDEFGGLEDSILEEGLPAWCDIDLVAWRMKMACVGDAKVIEVASQAADVGQDMGGLERALVDKGWDAARAKERARAVLVSDEGHFALREGWYKELRAAPKEVLIAKVKREMEAEAAQPRVHRQWCSCGVCYEG